MTHINQRRDTAANWTSTNPVLQLGEMGWENDTRKGKLGDGVTAWNDLLYIKTTATKSDVGLGNVDNTSDLNKPVSTAQQAALDAKANLASPVLTGNPTAPTPPPADNDTSLATTAFVKTALGLYAPLLSPVLTGNPTAPTPSPGDNDTSLATTAFVQAALAALVSSSSSSLVIGSLRIQWGSDSIDASAVAAGGLFNDTFTWPVAFSATPYFANAQGAGFVSGSSGAVCKTVDTLSTTTGRAVFLNTSDASMTFTAMPYRFWGIGPA